MRYLYLAPLAALAMTVACNDGPAALGVDPTLTGGANRLSLTATQTAEGLWEHRTEYDWKAQRYVSEIHVGHDMRLAPERDRVQILPGETVWITFQVDAQRRVASEETVEGVRGQTCVTNIGHASTSKFVIVEQVMENVNGSFRKVDAARSLVYVDEPIAAGGTRCVDYEVLFDTKPGVTYRVDASVVAHVGGHAATQARAEFSRPSTKSTAEIDAAAWMRDGAYAGCDKSLGPDFSCLAVDGIPRDQRIAPPTATGHLGMSFMVDIKNEGVCGKTFIYTIAEPLREGGPAPAGGEIRDVVGSLVITTGECPDKCVLPLERWQEKFGDGTGANVAHDFYAIVLGTARGDQSVWVNSPDYARFAFERAGVTNPIGELYAQLYAAKLNILHGADPRPARDARNAADLFLAAHNAQSWESLTPGERAAVSSWVEVLRRYNEGKAGEELCGKPDDEDDDDDTDHDGDDDDDSDGDDDGDGDEDGDDDNTGNACTRTIGYWKNHAGTGPQQDRLTPLLPIWLGSENGATSIRVTSASGAIHLLNHGGDASNGINKLYAQLLAAKLNIKSGTDGSVIAQTITAADAFLATHSAADWRGLSAHERAQVLTWMDTLDRYNNGKLGPTHCK
jgi:hypothetical protein